MTVRMPPPLPAAFFCRPTAEVARDLLGTDLWRRLPDGALLSGRIVETEAYFGPDDEASHAFRRTPRSEVMYGPGGRAYVYFTYGMHFCLNVVCGRQGKPGAVLLRALEPRVDLERMAALRGPAARDGRGGVDSRKLCSGPARLAQALAVDRTLNGADLRGEILRLTRGTSPLPDPAVVVTPRIGIRRATERYARYVVADSPFLSRPLPRH